MAHDDQRMVAESERSRALQLFVKPQNDGCHPKAWRGACGHLMHTHTAAAEWCVGALRTQTSLYSVYLGLTRFTDVNTAVESIKLRLDSPGHNAWALRLFFSLLLLSTINQQSRRDSMETESKGRREPTREQETSLND